MEHAKEEAKNLAAGDRHQINQLMDEKKELEKLLAKVNYDALMGKKYEF